MGFFLIMAGFKCCIEIAPPLVCHMITNAREKSKNQGRELTGGRRKCHTSWLPSWKSTFLFSLSAIQGKIEENQSVA